MQTYQQFKQAQTVTDLYEAPDAKDYHKWVQEANRISDPATYVINDENDFDDGEPNYLEKKRQEMEEAMAQFEPGELPELPSDDDGGPGPWGEDLSKSAPKPKVEAPPPSPVDTARQNNPGMAISNIGNFKQTGTLPNGTKFVQAGNNVNTIKTPQQMMAGGRTIQKQTTDFQQPTQGGLMKTQSYKEFLKTNGLDKQAEWYSGIQKWVTENPNLATGGAAALTGGLAYLLGAGSGRKRNRLLGLLAGILGGGAAYYGMKNYGLPYFSSLGTQKAPAVPTAGNPLIDQSYSKTLDNIAKATGGRTKSFDYTKNRYVERPDEVMGFNLIDNDESHLASPGDYFAARASQAAKDLRTQTLAEREKMIYGK